MIKLLLVIAAFYFIGCMFVDSIVVIMILAPIFHPIATKLGIAPILIGVFVTMQAVIGAVTPSFGCNIFTAMASVVREAAVSIVGEGNIVPYIGTAGEDLLSSRAPSRRPSPSSAARPPRSPAAPNSSRVISASRRGRSWRTSGVSLRPPDVP